MAPNKKTSSRELRGKTNQSLGEERVKTDELLEQNTQSVEEETDETIRRNRFAADKEVEKHRAEVDLEKEQRLDGTDTPPVVDSLLIQERERVDEVHTGERVEEDRARTQEQYQKQLFAEANLKNERKETDRNLLDERGHADSELITRDQFLAIVSHDLKNSILAIQLVARGMRSGLSLDAVDTVSLLKKIGFIEEAAAGMDQMISDLLDVERMTQNKLQLRPESVDLLVLLQECVDQFAPVVADKSFSMTIDASPGPIFADLDHDRILQVLSNLIGNSLKFTPNGGTIGLSARKQETDVEISVTDNGPGIPEQIQAQIFERFLQLHPNDHRGLGLGLFIAKWIVEAHKGCIRVASNPGKGCTFSFTLPLSVSE
ncbi:MAG: HAMP domain-containing sensor histidine kinase [Nitrospirales bacterium]